MISIKKFEFSPFQENTYVLFNQQNNAWIVDPGCYGQDEKQELKSFILDQNLKVGRLINTHCHLDHVFGNKFVCEEFDLLPEYHALEEKTMKLAAVSSDLYGIPGFEESPKPNSFLKENTTLTLDDDEFEIRFCPGHAPGHITLVNHETKIIIGGDVLFKNSIGRTDLPGGNHDQLLESIRTQLFTLDDEFIVFSGHGEETTIGYEKKNNPFLR